MSDSKKSGKKPIQDVGQKRSRKAKLERVSRSTTKNEESQKVSQGPEDLYRAVMNNIFFGFSLIDTHYKVVMVNSMISKYFHKPVKELIGKECFREFEKRNSVCPHCPGKRAKATGHPAEVETEGVFDDGSRFSARIQAFPTLDSNGTVTGFIEIVEDITERKKAEQEIKKSKDLLEKTFLSLDSAIFILDSANPPTILNCNPAATKIFGYTKKELLGKTTEFLHVDKKTLLEFKKILYPAIEKQNHLSFFEFRMKKKNGQIIPTEHFVRTLKNEGGKRIGWISIVRDITKRKRAEEALRETTQTLEAVIQASPLPIFALDRERIVKTWNPAAERTFGWSAQEVIGRKYPAIPEEKMDEADSLFSRAMESGLVKVETIRQRKDGSLIDVSISAAPLRDTHGNINGTMAVIADITERKKSEKKMRESEAKFRTLVEQIPDAVTYTAAMDKTSTTLYISPQIERLLGYTQAEYKDNPDIWVRQIHPEDRDRVLMELTRSHQTGERFVSEYRMIRKDGRLIWFHDVADVVRDDTGRPLFLLGINTDITELKKAELALKRERDKAQTYLDVAAVMIVAIDCEGRVGLINKKGCQILGYSEDEILAKNWFNNFLPKNVSDEVKDIFDKVLTGQADWPEYYENPVLTKNGDERLIAWHNTILRDDKGNVIAALSSGEDITECRKAAEILRQSEIKYRTLIEHIPQRVFLKDINSVYLSCNENYARDLNIKPEDIVGKTDYDFFPEELAEKYRRDDKRIINTEKIEDIEEKYIEHVKERWVHTIKTPYKDEEGNIIGVLGIFHDITERKKAECALRESEEKYRNIFENAQEAIITIDLKGNITNANKLVEEYGFKREELIGKNHFDFIAEEYRTSAVKGFERLIHGEIVEGEIKLITPTGDIIVEYRDNPIKREGEIVGVQAILTDITERKKAEDALRESEHEKTLVLDNASEIIAYHDKDNNILWANRAYLKATGLSLSEIKGKKCYHAWGLDRLCKDCPVTKAIKTGEPQSAELLPQNQPHWPPDIGSWLSRAAPVKDKTGSVIGAIEVAYDITERKQAEEKLIDYQTQLKSLASQLTLTEEHERRRIASVLHDQISQSLVIPKMRLEALCQSECDKKINATLEEVCNALGRTIKDMRSLIFEVSSPILEQLGFVEAVQDWLIEEIDKKHGIATEFEDDGQEKPLDDETRVFLFRDVRELLFNVVKHAQAKKVKVSTSKVDDQIQVSVEDDGWGFDPDKVPEMAVKKGAFGLFSIRERLKQLGGRLEVKSAPGCGCKVTMIAPLKHDVARKARDDQKA